LAELGQLLAQLEQLGQLGQLAELAQLVGAQVSAPPRMPISLLVIQPTPFCNLDCSYCYLPNRSDRSRMSPATLEATIAGVFESGLAGGELSIVWHAGEPLALPCRYYRDAFALVERIRPARTAVRHHFQTNATLIDDEWCDLIAAHEVRIGVSLDGPAWLHDRCRKTRSGHGTHARVMRGVAKLRERGIPFHAICVLTSESLRHPDEVFEFFRDAGIGQVGFNIEELEAAHGTTSLSGAEAETEFKRFLGRLLERVRAEPAAMRVREFDTVLAALADPGFGVHDGNCQTEPGGIVSVAVDGQVSTFSPELLGMRDPRLGEFAFGNVRASGLGDILRGERLRRVAAEIAAGVAACKASCRYFAFCRGGAPVNKLSEKGSFSTTETVFCRLTQKAVVECVLGALERDLAPSPGKAGGAAWYDLPVHHAPRPPGAADAAPEGRSRDRPPALLAGNRRDRQPAAVQP
jgi:uncharacterized protein